MEHKVNESRGLHEFVRVGRPDVLFDCRTKYSIDKKEFEKSMNDRKRIAFDDTHTEVIGGFAITEQLSPEV